MINRENWKKVKLYLAYLEEVKQNDAQTIRKRWSQLRYLLEWSDEMPIAKAPEIRPTFPRYLSTLDLAYSSTKRACGVARAFLIWLRMNDRKHHKIAEAWIETLQPVKVSEAPKERVLFSLSEVRQIANLPVETLTAQRDQAAIAFLFLSGMRVGAFVTLTLACVDIAHRTVKQWPVMGVQTKNDKTATTFLLDIPDLIEIVKRWDDLVRAQLPETALWYAPLSTDGASFVASSSSGVTRRGKVADGLRRLCENAGIAYQSPHKLRHGHAVYALERAKDMADLKAVSQNLMHANISTTDGIYTVLKSDNVKARIDRLTR